MVTLIQDIVMQKKYMIMGYINRMHINEKKIDKTGIMLGNFLEKGRERKEAWFILRIK